MSVQGFALFQHKYQQINRDPYREQWSTATPILSGIPACPALIPNASLPGIYINYQTTLPWKNGMLGLEHNVPQPGIKSKPKMH
jgi:hypothetical protein